MTFAIITHAVHIQENSDIFAYGPYVKEMNIWLKYVDDVIIVSPVAIRTKSTIDLSYLHKKINVISIPTISLISFIQIVKTIFKVPLILIRIFVAMHKADHIHLRCPGNIGLLGCLIQVFFPRKIKTAKYAGNWDPNAKQPRSYRFQKWILSNTFLTRNMTVLVYGKWPEQSENIKSFFTASYRKNKINEAFTRSFDSEFNFLFVGSLVSGKRPLFAVKLVEALFNSGVSCRLSMYGDGVKRKDLEAYIIANNLTKIIHLFGNQSGEIIEDVYKKSQFLLLPSKSEGWPKVVAEAMFWGVIPIVTKISCVPWMLGRGDRGFLIDGELETDVSTLLLSLENTNRLNEMSKKGMVWSHSYTLDEFESQIKELL